MQTKSLIDITKEFQSASGVSTSSSTVCREIKNLALQPLKNKPNFTLQSGSLMERFLSNSIVPTVKFGGVALWFGLASLVPVNGIMN